MTNPEQAVLDAINGLEADEIGERVRWQLEEGMARGEHLPEGDDELTEEEVDEIVDILTEIATGVPNFSRTLDAMLDPTRRAGESVAELRERQILGAWSNPLLPEAVTFPRGMTAGEPIYDETLRLDDKESR